MKTKAAVLYEYGKPLVVDELAALNGEDPMEGVPLGRIVWIGLSLEEVEDRFEGNASKTMGSLEVVLGFHRLEKLKRWTAWKEETG